MFTARPFLFGITVSASVVSRSFGFAGTSTVLTDLEFSSLVCFNFFDGNLSTSRKNCSNVHMFSLSD